jgi:hypothetical protein
MPPDPNMTTKTVSGGASIEAPSALPVITGSWVSESPEPAGNGFFMRREYAISLNRWELTQTYAADPEIKKPLFVYRAEGAYTIEVPYSKIPGAFFTNFRLSRQFLTLKSKDKSFMEDFEFNDCKISFGIEKNISKDGCSTFRPINECSQIYDLVKIEKGQLRLGEKPRDGDLCTIDKRPDYLGPQLKKIN